MPDNCLPSRKRSGASPTRNGKWKSKLNEERWKIGRSVPQWCRVLHERNWPQRVGLWRYRSVGKPQSMCAAKESQTKEDEGLSAPVLRHLHGERDDLTQVSRWTELLTFILR